MVYDLLLADFRTPGDLALALAKVFALPLTDVDVASEDLDDPDKRTWSALVLATYGEQQGDIALSLSITTVLDPNGPQLTEAALAARLAERLATPILYAATSFPPSAYWLTDGHGQPCRARLEPSDELGWTIAAVDRPVPALPRVLVTPIPEVIREHRLPTPLADAFAKSREARNALAAWESFVARLIAGWPPDGWYPADYYAEDLEYRDVAEELMRTLPSELAAGMAAALRTLDDDYVRSTTCDAGLALSQALGLPATDLAERAWHWRRRPAELPWPTPTAAQLTDTPD